MLKKGLVFRYFYIANLILIFISIVYILSIFKYPFIGIGLEKSGVNWVINDVNKYGQGLLLGVRNGDRFVSINGLRPEVYETVQKWREVEKAATLEIINPNGFNLIKIPKPNFINIVLDELTMFLIGICFLVNGLISYYKKPYVQKVRAFILVDLFYWFSDNYSPSLKSSNNVVW